MLFKALVSTLALAATAYAQISFTQPVAGTVWTAGQSAVIQWQGKNGAALPSKGDKNDKDLTIELLWGPSGSVVTLGTLIKAKLSDQTATINVYDKLIGGNQYALRANGADYSDQFQIQSSVNTGNPATVRVPTSSTSDASKHTCSVLAAFGAVAGAVLMA